MAEPWIEIAGRRVGGGAPVLVLAEAGVNHDGDPDTALALVDAAVEAGADAVKFQAFVAEDVAAPAAAKAAYQLRTTDASESQLAMLRRLELDRSALRAVEAHCRARGIVFLASAFDPGSVELLDELGAPAIKIGSGELTNLPLLERIAATGRPALLSTGMADLDEVARAVATLRRGGPLALLHCVSQYPADPAEANLRALETLRDAFDVPVGFSDHTEGAETAIAAVALGAALVEKHLTLDRRGDGPDHAASLEPEEFAAFVDALRLAQSALGDGVKRPAPSERENRVLVRRSLVAARDLDAGAVLAPDDLAAVRPGDGIAPTHLAELVGRRLARPVAALEQLAWTDLA